MRRLLRAHLLAQELSVSLWENCLSQLKSMKQV